MPLKFVSVRNLGAVSVAELSGRVTLGAETNSLRETLKGLLAQGHKNMVLNLSGVDYIDSSGLGTLVGLFTTFNSEGGKLKLCNVGLRFHEVLAVTKLLTVFDIYDNEAAAVASYGSAARA